MNDEFFHEDDETPVVPEKIDFKSKDIQLYNQWNQTKSKKDLTTLVNHLSPLIYKEVSRASGTLPLAALNAEGKNWAIKAIHTYDPDKGFALSTHVTNYLQRVRRMNYKYQHAARLPENMKREFHKYNTGLTLLTDELSRDPTDEELAAKLGWSKGNVVKFRSRIYADSLESSEDKPSEVYHYDDNNLLMNEVMTHLTPDEKTILKYKGTISANELAAKLGVNNNRLNYLQNKLVSKIKDMKDKYGF